MDVYASNSKANALLDIQRYDKAIEYYDRVLAKEPSDVDALNKAFALANLDKNEEALPLINKVLKSDSNNEYYLSTAALIMYNLGKTEDAKTYFEKAQKINANLTSILSEKELDAFNKLMNNNTKQ